MSLLSRLFAGDLYEAINDEAKNLKAEAAYAWKNYFRAREVGKKGKRQCNRSSKNSRLEVAEQRYSSRRPNIKGTGSVDLLPRKTTGEKERITFFDAVNSMG